MGKPQPGWLKINTDASFVKENGTSDLVPLSVTILGEQYVQPGARLTCVTLLRKLKLSHMADSYQPLEFVLTPINANKAANFFSI
jgi:hypothetical protein